LLEARPGQEIWRALRPSLRPGLKALSFKRRGRRLVAHASAELRARLSRQARSPAAGAAGHGPARRAALRELGASRAASSSARPSAAASVTTLGGCIVGRSSARSASSSARASARASPRAAAPASRSTRSAAAASCSCSGARGRRAAGRRAARCRRRHARRHAPRADDAQLDRAARVLPARRDELERVAGVERVPHARGEV